jgi:hypothetical protein
LGGRPLRLGGVIGESAGVGETKVPETLNIID